MGLSLAIPRVIPNDWKRLDLIINKIKMRLGRDSSPTFANVYAGRVYAGHGTEELPAHTFTDHPDAGMFLTGAPTPELRFSVDGHTLFSMVVTDWDTDDADINAHVPFRLINGTAARPSLTFAADPNTGLYRVGSDQLGITTAGTLRATFANAGLSLTGYIDQSDIADPGAPGASKSRLFSNSGHTVSLSPGDIWHDLSMGGKGTSSCVHDAITVTHVGGSGLDITWSAGTIFDAAISGGNQMVTIAAQPANQACTASSLNYLFFDRSGGVLVLNTSGPDYSDGDFSIAHILATHNDIFEILYRPVSKEVTHNIKWSLREAFPNVVVSGLVVSAHAGDGVWDVDQSAGSFVHGGFSLKTSSLIDSTVTNIIRWYHNAANAWETDTNAQIDNANWDDDDDGATVKVTSAGKYYRSVFVTCGDCIHWVYPQVEYANLAAALAGPDPTLPAVLEHLPKTTVLIMKHNDAALPAVGSDQWIDVRPILGVVSTGASIADHGSLTGLGDDDHIQYIKDAEFTQDSGVLVGTGAGAFQEETGATLRTSLGLAIGTNVQAWDAQLDDIAALAVTDGNFIVGDGTNWVAESGATARASLGLTIGTHVQAYDAGLLSLAGLTYAAAAFVKMTGANTFVLRTIGETADDLQGTIDHDLTANFDANEHIDHTGVNIASGKGLSGGGDISSTRTLALDLTEMTGNVIWNDGSTDASITWTYALSGANDPVWTIGANSMDLTTGVLKVGGTTVMLVGGAPTAHLHDGDTLEHDGVNSSAGSFAFTTGGIVTFSESITMSAGKDLTIAGHIIFNTNNSYIGFTNPRITFNDTSDRLDITGGIIGSATATFEGASVTVGKASTTTGTLVLHDSGSANTITLTVPNALAGSLTFTLPPTDGANTNVLQTDGNGVLTWVAASGGQTQGDVLDDLNTLGAVTGDSYFLVGTGAGVFAWETTTTVRTSLGLGTGDSPQFTGIELGHATDTTITRASAGNLNIEGNLVYRAGGTDVPIGDGGTGQSTAQAAIDALSAVSGATNEHVLTKDTASGNAIWKVAGAGASTWIALTDTDPANYTGEAGNAVVVNAGEDGLEFGGPPAGFTSRCSAYRNGVQAITTGTWTKVLINAVDYDIWGAGGQEFVNEAFYPAVTGYYHISVGLQLSSLGDGKVAYAAIYKNGTIYKANIIAPGVATTVYFMSSCDMYLIGGNDRVELWTYHTHGSNRNVGHATNRYTFMDVHRFA